jgi:hypothetical protein
MAAAGRVPGRSSGCHRPATKEASCWIFYRFDNPIRCARRHDQSATNPVYSLVVARVDRIILCADEYRDPGPRLAAHGMLRSLVQPQYVGEEFPRA